MASHSGHTHAYAPAFPHAYTQTSKHHKEHALSESLRRFSQLNTQMKNVETSDGQTFGILLLSGYAALIFRFPSVETVVELTELS